MKKLTEDFKNEIKKAIESGKTTDWGYDGENEFEYDTYDVDFAFNEVLKVIKKHYDKIQFTYVEDLTEKQQERIEKYWDKNIVNNIINSCVPKYFVEQELVDILSVNDDDVFLEKSKLWKLLKYEYNN
jgi:hypothetical protein